MSTSTTGYILIVDDTPANIEVVSETLTDAGFEVASVLSGERALNHTQHSEPALILLDVMMSGIDGFETCRRFKADPATCNIPIIFMTALADIDSKVKGFDLGAVDYITKPFQEQEILARVKTHLHLSSLTKTLEQKVSDRTAQLSHALQEVQASQVQLVQSEKMSALGQLVAGVAHEINNPVGCIYGNLTYVEQYMKDLLEIVALYQEYHPQPAAPIQNKLNDVELDYLREDLPKLVQSLQDSAHRIRDISTSLRTFSRVDNDRPVVFNLHEGIDSTILILKHRLNANAKRPAIEVIKNYGNIPQVECFAGQLNQVFMNIIANAIDALEDMHQGQALEDIPAQNYQITIQTALTNNQQGVLISIKDNGIGMSEEVKQKIFDHLFTTKDIGKGTGLGLAIAHQIIVEKHGGTINVHSVPGQGSEFAITLPIQPHAAAFQQKI
ncbi:response regulator [Dendronalium sp. ChiSLP03b]|uniref:hybrid sensor histidine kinase/response regulator n=1 Tax=Dendronalium sp. ChiSLP03b TaxID=3075381 RepID=UPI002AD3A6CD|nr:response regulator [Dendronalium sp. ChiSLP03b]MDZ8208446.1 response regulator [Dendronalium sp. ChiSLP03b]